MWNAGPQAWSPVSFWKKEAQCFLWNAPPWHSFLGYVSITSGRLQHLFSRCFLHQQLAMGSIPEPLVHVWPLFSKLMTCDLSPWPSGDLVCFLLEMMHCYWQKNHSGLRQSYSSGELRFLITLVLGMTCTPTWKSFGKQIKNFPEWGPDARNIVFRPFYSDKEPEPSGKGGWLLDDAVYDLNFGFMPAQQKTLLNSVSLHEEYKSHIWVNDLISAFMLRVFVQEVTERHAKWSSVPNISRGVCYKRTWPVWKTTQREFCGETLQMFSDVAWGSCEVSRLDFSWFSIASQQVMQLGWSNQAKLAWINRNSVSEVSGPLHWRRGNKPITFDSVWKTHTPEMGQLWSRETCVAEKRPDCPPGSVPCHWTI